MNESNNHSSVPPKPPSKGFRGKTAKKNNLHQKKVNPSTVASPTATDINNDEKSASPPPMLPHACSPPEVAPPTSSRIPNLAN
jgi:hypothetical protein